MDKEYIAGLLSFVVPGFGQLYNGAFLWAIFWAVVIPGVWVFSAGTLGLVFHGICGFAAYRHRQEIEAKQPRPHS